MTLHELEIGDKFIAINDKAKHPAKFIVKGSPMFNIRHGRPTRMCIKLTERGYEEVSKSCGLEVRKIGESKHKEKMNNAVIVNNNTK